MIVIRCSSGLAYNSDKLSGLVERNKMSCSGHCLELSLGEKLHDTARGCAIKREAQYTNQAGYRAANGRDLCLRQILTCPRVNLTQGRGKVIEHRLPPGHR